MSQEIPFSKKDHRKLTPFVGQEFLYDYLCQKLDPERKQALEELIAQSRPMQEEIEVLKKAMVYVEFLQATQVSAGLVEKIQAPTSYFQGLLHKIRFGDWPVGIKLGIEVLIVSVLVFSVIIVVPWHRVSTINWLGSSNGTVTLVQVDESFHKPSALETEIAAKEVRENEKAALTYQDEGSGSKSTAVATPSAAVPSVPPTVAASAPKPTGVVPSVPPPGATPAPKEVAAVVTKPLSSPGESKSAVTQGYLYRGTISVTNLTATSQKFVEKISEFGGRRAGEVELGWKKGDGTYFHFTIPEAKYEALAAYLNEYGKLNIQKEKHERVMPDGIIRLIISVAEDKKKAK